MALADEKWLDSLDWEAFASDIKDLGNKLQQGQGEEDVAHLKKIIRWADILALIGLFTMWMTPNPITILAISTAVCARWTMVAHHVCHGGYDKADSTKTYNRRTYALGSLWRRFWDWFDWFLPEAWNVEHNNLHHYSLSELTDPDLVEANSRALRKSEIPMFAKYLQVAFFMATWKWFYYAPNTYKELKLAQLRRAGKQAPAGLDSEGEDRSVTILTVFGPYIGRPETPINKLFTAGEFVTRVVAPFAIYHFAVLPLPLLYLGGWTWYFNAVVNLLLAEIVTNAHTFLIVVPNHAGDDLYKFDTRVDPKSPAFFLRQVISSVDFATGSDVNDFLHGWLNYQIEHHLWPNLSMLSYQRSQPLVKALCAKHGVPYIQHSVWWRLWKTVEIMTGQTSMRKFPEEHDKFRESASSGGVAAEENESG